MSNCYSCSVLLAGGCFGSMLQPHSCTEDANQLPPDRGRFVFLREVPKHPLTDESSEKTFPPEADLHDKDNMVLFSSEVCESGVDPISSRVVFNCEAVEEPQTLPGCSKMLCRGES